MIISPQNEYAGVLFVTGLCYMHTVYYESATLSLSLSLYHNTLGIPLTMHTHDVPVMSHLSKCRFPCRPSLTSVLFAVPLVVLGFWLLSSSVSILCSTASRSTFCRADVKWDHLANFYWAMWACMEVWLYDAYIEGKWKKIGLFSSKLNFVPLTNPMGLSNFNGVLSLFVHGVGGLMLHISPTTCDKQNSMGTVHTGVV